jgi:hypothetical protein
MVFRTWLAELIHAFPVADERLPFPTSTPTELTNSASLLQATFVWPLFIAVSAAFSFANNPFFWVPVKDDALTEFIRF